jgi:hypothetical protein
VKYKKFPRIHHLPFSEGITADDLILDNLKNFYYLDEVVITEKLDGENENLYRDKVHARSIDSNHHVSRNWIFKFHYDMSYLIPKNLQICGEYLYAKHSIEYDKLETYFYVFGIFENNIYLSWDEVFRISNELNLKTVPELYRGKFDLDKIKRCYSGISKFGNIQEGYVLRNSGSFDYDDFDKNIAKFVRKQHVQTDKHWLRNWELEKNKDKLINKLED